MAVLTASLESNSPWAGLTTTNGTGGGYMLDSGEWRQRELHCLVFQNPPTGKSARHAHGPGAPPPVLCRRSEAFRVRARRMCAYLVLLLHVVVSNSRRPLGNRVERLVFSFSFSPLVDGCRYAARGSGRGRGRANGEAGAVAATGIAVLKLCMCSPLDARAPMQLLCSFGGPAENARDSRCSCSHRTFSSSQSLLTL